MALKFGRKPSGSCGARLSAAFAPFFTALRRLGGILTTVQPPFEDVIEYSFWLSGRVISKRKNGAVDRGGRLNVLQGKSRFDPNNYRNSLASKVSR